MKQWVDQLEALRKAHTEIMLVTVASVRGSAPREVGAKMLVTAEHSVGTIGGGQLEYQCTRIAFEHLRDYPATRRFWRRFPLGADLGQCCGGVVEVLFERYQHGESRWLDELYGLYSAREPVVMATASDNKLLVTANNVISANDSGNVEAIVTAAREMLQQGIHRACSADHNGQLVLYEPVAEGGIDVAIFGAGHVGSACVATLSQLDCKIRWIDSRRNAFPDVLPAGVMRVDAANPSLEVAAMPPGSYYLVMTHSHPLDYDICQRILMRDDVAYCGLIGSKAKRQRFSKIMRECALPAAALEKLTCPIGVQGLRGKKPEEIAIAVTAQLLQVRDAVSVAKQSEKGTWKHTSLTG